MSSTSSFMEDGVTSVKIEPTLPHSSIVNQKDNEVFETKTVYVESKCKEFHISTIKVPDSLSIDLVSKVMER